MFRKIMILCLMGLAVMLCAKEEIKLSDGFRLELGKPQTFKFKQQDADTRQFRLCFDARFDWDSLIGYTTGVMITINGQPVPAVRILNKPIQFKVRSGSSGYWGKPDSKGIVLMYSPDFSDKIKTDETFKYGIYEDEQDPYRFVLDLTGLTRHVGENELTFSGVFTTSVFRDVRIEIDAERMPRINDPTQMIKPAPTGKLDDLQLRLPDFPAPETVIAANGGVTVAGMPLKSRFSLPDGKWLEIAPQGKQTRLGKGASAIRIWNTPEYRLERRIEIKDDHVKIYDRLINRRDEITGVIFSHSLDLDFAPEKVLRGGLDSALGKVFNSSHPSVFALGQKTAAALLAEDDILRNQGYFGWREKSIILGNDSLGIPPRKAHTLEWSIYVMPDGSYYDFVNTVRKNWNSNFTMQGLLAFPYKGSNGLRRWMKKEVTEQDIKEYLKEWPVNLIMTHVASNIQVKPSEATAEKPFLGHGAAIRHFGWWGDMTGRMIAAFSQYAPQVKVFAYMHKNLCSEYGCREKYSDSLGVDPETVKLMESNKIYGRFVPTPNNSYGRELALNYQYLIDKLDANIYMDEICLSITKWAPYKEWDNCTVEIDPKTHTVIRPLSIPNLLVMPWLEEMIEYMNSKGKSLMANGPPATRTLQNHRALHFIEHCMGESGLISAHFSTPLAWEGYHMGLKGFEHFRDSLDHGALAITWSGEWNNHTFPFTPLELNAGYVIGEECIVTRRSGSFGWGDASDMECYVYNGHAERVEKPDVKTVSGNGVNRFEIRMPSDHVAILVRKTTK